MATDLMVQGESEVSGLVRLAIEEKVSVEVLERLVALQERVSDRSARSAFVASLSAFQAECPTLARSKEVDYTTKAGVRVRYHFASLDVIATTVRPFLAKHGLSYSWDSSLTDGQLEVVCTLHHVEGCSRTASFRCATESAGSPTMNGPQKAGSATAYGQRYSLIQVLGLTTADEDKDGAGRHGSAEVITESQAADLEVLLAEVGTNRKRFLDWIGAESVEQLTVDKYARAVAELEARRK